MTQHKVKDTKHSRASGLETIYTLFLALMIALFFGLSISAFYIQPKEPEYPTILQVNSKGGTMTSEQLDAQYNYDLATKSFQKEFSVYNRNVSIITLVLAIIALTVGLLFFENIFVISNGLLLGGLFTLLYSMVRGFMSDNTQFRLIVVTVGLIVAIVLGYIKFIKPRRTQASD